MEWPQRTPVRTNRFKTHTMTKDVSIPLILSIAAIVGAIFISILVIAVGATIGGGLDFDSRSPLGSLFNDRSYDWEVDDSHYLDSYYYDDEWDFDTDWGNYGTGEAEYSESFGFGYFSGTNYIFDTPDGWWDEYRDWDLTAVHSGNPATSGFTLTSVAVSAEDGRTLEQVIDTYSDLDVIDSELVSRTTISSPTPYGEPVELPVAIYSEDIGSLVNTYYFIDTTAVLGEGYGQTLVFDGSIYYQTPAERDAQIRAIETMVRSTRFAQ